MDAQALREAKLAAIAAGELAGEDAAKRVFRNSGIDAVAKTLGHSGLGAAGPVHAKRFVERWGREGDDNWQNLAMSGPHKDVHPYHVRAHDEAYARGARRFCEMVVRGYLDAELGLTAEGPKGTTIADMERAIEVRRRKSVLGERANLIWAYEAGHAAFRKQAGHGE
jgi:hypothetical protein